MLSIHVSAQVSALRNHSSLYELSEFRSAEAAMVLPELAIGPKQGEKSSPLKAQPLNSKIIKLYGDIKKTENLPFELAIEKYESVDLGSDGRIGEGYTYRAFVGYSGLGEPLKPVELYIVRTGGFTGHQEVAGPFDIPT